VSYSYEAERKNLFTEEGVATLTKMRDEAKRLIGIAGAASAGKIMAVATGSSWTMLAALDYMVEKGDIRRVTEKGATCGQHQIFTVPAQEG
jgi:hypothetical protein